MAVPEVLRVEEEEVEEVVEAFGTIVDFVGDDAIEEEAFAEEEEEVLGARVFLPLFLLFPSSFGESLGFGTRLSGAGST